MIWFRPVKKGYRAGGGWQNAVPARIVGILGRRWLEWYSFGPKKRDIGPEVRGGVERRRVAADIKGNGYRGAGERGVPSGRPACV